MSPTCQVCVACASLRAKDCKPSKARLPLCDLMLRWQRRLHVCLVQLECNRWRQISNGTRAAGCRASAQQQGPRAANPIEHK